MFFQVNFKLLLYPFWPYSCNNESEFNKSIIDKESSSLYKGFIKTAQLLVTYGIEVKLDVITGVEQLIASRGGRPKPSYNDG